MAWRGSTRKPERRGCKGHLDDTVRPLLSEPWVLDCDTTIKLVYGHQEGAVVGYNPKKPGRPSHAYHAFLMAGTRLALDVVVTPGNRHTSKTSQPPLWALLGRLGREHWPSLVRGDKDWGCERSMASCEGAGLDYLFKLRLTKGVRRLAERLMARRDWVDAGQGWWGVEADLRLQVWSRSRRVVILRRRLTSHHARRSAVVAALRRISTFFRELARTAEQLSVEGRWRRILAEALKKHLGGRQPGRKPWLTPPQTAPTG